MSFPFLSTKLYIPPVRRRLVSRPRLIEQLNQWPDYPLILISAPAGYGKTTLLSAWLQQCSCRTAWISLDEGDNDLKSFLAYMIAALQMVQAGIGESLLSVLQSPQALSVNGFVSILINGLAPLNDPFVLVLDDYHVIQEPLVHQAVNFLLDHLPWQMHLVISTRADPPLPLARLRARSQILELRAAELCFTTPEVDKFLNQSMGLSISGDDVGALAARTEGWIAGLQMAAVSMQGQQDTSRFIQSFTGSNRHILDYLLEEVLEQQSESVNSFLLKSSILDRLTGSLCDAVTEQTDSQSMLDCLERLNLFIVPLDDQRCWFRYHHLFADLLRQRLQNLYPSLKSDLHMRASKWFEENNLFAEAIRHALSSGEFFHAAHLIEKTADSTFMHGEIKTFLSWVERLPDGVARQFPLLCVYHAEALLLSGKSMSQATNRLEGTPEYDAIQALTASYKGDIGLSKKLSAKALAHLPEESVFLRGAITSALGAVLLLSGEVEPAIQTFKITADIGREHGNLMLAVIALSRLGQLHLLKGELHRAEEFLQEAIELSTDRQGNYLPVASMPLMPLAYILREWNNLDSAHTVIQKAIQLSQESGGFWLVDCYVTDAFILQAQGHSEEALQAIRNARKISSLTRANRFDEIYTAAYEAQIFLVQGNLEAALQWARQARLDPDGEFGEAEATDRASPLLFHLYEIEQMTLARIFIAQGKVEGALATLSSILPDMEVRGRTSSIIENLILQSLAFQTQGKSEKALQVLKKALSLAEPSSLIQVFVKEGQPMERLLKMAVDHKIALAYIPKLLEAFGDEKLSTRSISSSQKLVESLSKRELEVLDLIADGLSNREIAERLVISLSTVKGHTANIFSKLAVDNRTQAVSRARDLSLIQ